MDVIRRLLRRNLSPVQLLTFALANLVGLAIITVGLQFYADLRRFWTDEESFIRKDYMVISRRVEGVDIDSGSGFTPEMLADVAAQPWVRRVAPFTASAYKVSATIGGSGGLSTLLFFEAVPRDFVDTGSESWTYTPGSDEVPVIIAKDYLSLYNFGLAGSGSMPRLSELMMRSIPLSLSISPAGGGAPVTMRARIVGFSSRLNTILVPQEFIDWSNALYGGEPAAPSRLIVDISSPGDTRIAPWMEAHGYETTADKSASQSAFLLNLAMGVVVAIGLTVTLLSFVILTLSVSLLMQKNRPQLHRLIMLGYPLGRVGAPYRRSVLLTSVGALVLSIGVMLCVRGAYLDSVLQLGAGAAAPWLSIGVATALTTILTALNVVAVNRRVARAFRI